MKRVGNPAASPDGRWVVFSVTEPFYDEKKEVSDLWIVPADGSRAPAASPPAGPPRAGPRGARTRAAWPSAAKREDDEAAQIYVMDMAGRGRGAPRDVPAPGRPVAGVEPRRPCPCSSRAPSTGAPPTRRPTGRSSRSARTPSRRSGSTTASPSSAGTSGWTTPRAGCSWWRSTGTARPATCWRAPRLVGLPGYGGPAGEGSHGGPRRGLEPRRQVRGLRRHHEPEHRGPRPDQLAPVRGPGGRRRAPAAHHGQRRPPGAPSSPPMAAPSASAVDEGLEGSTPSSARPAPPGPGPARRGSSPPGSTARWATSRCHRTAGRCT